MNTCFFLRRSPTTAIALLVLNLLSCSGRHVLKEYSQRLPARVAFAIELTDIAQKSAADSIAAELSSRLLAYSAERGDFVTARPGEPYDLRLRLMIADLKTIDWDSQVDKAVARRRIEKVYEEENDSLRRAFKPRSKGEIVARNVVGTVVPVMLLGPAGIASVSMVTVGSPKVVQPSPRDQYAIDKTYTTARLKYEASIEEARGKRLWRAGRELEYTLTEVVRESAQLQLLCRNVVLDLEGTCPLLRLP